MQRTTVDKEICIGCAMCVATCPNSYRLEGTPEVSEALLSQQDSEELLQISVEECPVGAISFVSKPCD